jgi:3-hydroxyacyl-[acyl-carrier-protein] dehydratase
MVEQHSEIVSSSIFQLLPHRYPFLLVDKVLSFEPHKELKALKNVTVNEPFFQGHFPEYPVMPGVLIVESLAQAGGILVIKSTSSIPKNKIILFSAIEKVRFRKPVYPGDQLLLHVKQIRQKMNLCKIHAEAYVQDDLVAQGIFTAAMVDKEGKE